MDGIATAPSEINKNDSRRDGSGGEGGAAGGIQIQSRTPQDQSDSDDVKKLEVRQEAAMMGHEHELTPAAINCNDDSVMGMF